jgi:imidazole glycerol-phosphate synthase subunit HisH
MNIAIIKYNSGNVQSVQFALQRLGVNAIVTDNKKEICQADKVIFPGVGHANAAMQYLKEKELDTVIKTLQQPVLGICLGLQLLCKSSAEGDTQCLGVFDASIKQFVSTEFKIPHVGWNTIYDCKSLLFKDIKADSFVYNVHSYYAALSIQTIATTNYIIPYSAALQKNNFYAVQFHPEKSGDVGEMILNNFINL